jgi:hypothetical protein
MAQQTINSNDDGIDARTKLNSMFGELYGGVAELASLSADSFIFVGSVPVFAVPEWNGKIVVFETGSAGICTIPAGMPEAFAFGWLNIGAGDVTFAKGDGVVSLNGFGDALTTAGRWSEGWVKAYRTEQYHVGGTLGGVPDVITALFYNDSDRKFPVTLGDSAVDLFAFGGQSNAYAAGVQVGFGSVSEPPHYTSLDTSIQIWNGSAFATYDPYGNSGGLAVGGTDPAGAWGAEAELAYQYRLANPAKICYLTKVAIGATSLDFDWNPNVPQYWGSLLRSMLAPMRALILAGKTPQLHFVWYQGESDRGASQSAAWEGHFQEVCSIIRLATKSPLTPTAIVRILPYADPYTTEVRAAQAAAAGSVTNAALVNTDDFSTFDGTHIVAANLTTLGQRVLTALNGLNTGDVPALPFSWLSDGDKIRPGRWEDFGLVLWTTGQADPEGGTTGVKMTDDSGGGSRKEAYQFSPRPTNRTQWQVVAKEAGPNKRYLELKAWDSGVMELFALFDLAAATVTDQASLLGGGIVAATAVSLGGGWCRCTLEFTHPNTNHYLSLALAKHATDNTWEGNSASCETYTGDGASGVVLAHPRAWAIEP